MLHGSITFMSFFEAVRKGEIVMDEQFTGEYNIVSTNFSLQKKWQSSIGRCRKSGCTI
jgi:hypothetical protein